MKFAHAQQLILTSTTSLYCDRVILGIDPVTAKTGTEGLFPLTQEEKSTAKLAKAALNKRKKMNETPADRTLNRALEAIARDEDGSSSDNLRVTSTELLILLVLSSQGIPVHCDEWQNIVQTGLEDESMGSDFRICFDVMAGAAKASSEVWLETARLKLEDKVRLLKTMEAGDATRSNIVDEISILQKDYDFKKTTYIEMDEFCEHPLSFAKKIITLLEAVRKNIGSVDLVYAGEKKIRALNKSENGLGTKCLNWLTKELARWGKVSLFSIALLISSNSPVFLRCTFLMLNQSLGATDKHGNVNAATSIKSTKDHPQSHDSAVRVCHSLLVTLYYPQHLLTSIVQFSRF